ncbi:MAG: nucleoside phosphorylase [Planctomycetota bacterium]|jgi:uridine phosphorylase
MDSRGRPYHLGIAAADLADRVLLFGDPERTERAAALLEEARVVGRHREFTAVTGAYGGQSVTLLGTGIGPDNTEIAVVELSQLREGLTLLRVGTSGSLQETVRPGDLVITTEAVRLENTSLAYVPEGTPATAHEEVVEALATACKGAGATFHRGKTATAPGFYAPQGRTVPGFEPRDPDLPARLAKEGVLNMEMEASCLLTLAPLGGHRAGVLCVAIAGRTEGSFLSEEERLEAERTAIAVALEAVVAA